MADRLEFDRLFSFGRTVTLEIPEIVHETDTSILIEWNRQNAWVLKEKVKIEKREGGLTVQMPKWLFNRKFS